MLEGEEKADFYQVVRGFTCPVSERFTRKNIEDAMDLVPGDGDTIIASYPKTGTTWMQYIVLQIISKGETYPQFDDATYKVVPYVELAGVAAVHAQSEPRLYKSHIAYDFLQKNPKSKVLYTYRHPEDTIVSFYHFILNLSPEFPLKFDQFFDVFLTGKIGYGSYFEHVLSFYKHRNDKNLLMVSYEKLYADRREKTLEIAEFLGEEHHRSLLEDEEMLDGILERTSFGYMKKNLIFTHPDIKLNIQPGEKNTNVEFFRKGIVGDGKTVLTDVQRQLLREAAEKVLRGTAIMEEWYPE